MMEEVTAKKMKSVNSIKFVKDVNGRRKNR